MNTQKTTTAAKTAGKTLICFLIVSILSLLTSWIFSSLNQTVLINIAAFFIAGCVVSGFIYLIKHRKEKT